MAPLSTKKGFQVLAVYRLIARIPFILGLREINLASVRLRSALPYSMQLIRALGLVSFVLVLPHRSYSADISQASVEHQKIIARNHLATVKAEANQVVKALATEQKSTCRQEFSESLANALEKAKEQYRKLRLELVESSPRRRNTGM
jgi:hypothetical protein